MDEKLVTRGLFLDFSLTYKFVIWFLEYIDLVYFSLTTFIHVCVVLFFAFLLFFCLIHVNIVTLAHLNSLNFLLSLFLTLFRKVLIQIKIPM